LGTGEDMSGRKQVFADSNVVPRVEKEKKTGHAYIPKVCDMTAKSNH